MVSPHPPLAVNKPSQDQQAKQDGVHHPEDLEGGKGGGEGGGRRTRSRRRGRKEEKGEGSQWKRKEGACT